MFKFLNNKLLGSGFNCTGILFPYKILNFSQCQSQRQLQSITFYSFPSFNITTEEREKLKIRYKKYQSGRKVLKKSKKEKSIQIKQNNVVVHQEPMSPMMKAELDKHVEGLTGITRGQGENSSLEKAHTKSGIFDSGRYMERMAAHDYMKNIDSSFEGFFFKREFNLNNFNFYIQVLARQGKREEAENALTKMEEMGIKPNMDTYNQLMVAYARDKNIEKCEEVFDLLKNKKKMVPNKFLYNSLLLAYAKNMKTHEADALMREMREEGINPDIVCYTTLIHAYKRAKLYNKCWELYDEACSIGVADEFLMSYMVRMCGATHDVEKALNIFQVMEVKGFIKFTSNYNSIIYALSSRKDYAEKALEFFHKMKLSGVKPDLYTYVGVLRATSHLGDIHTANDVVKEIKLLGYKVNEHICNGLLRTYAGASRIPYVKVEHLESYINDAWEIYKFMEKENIPISVNVLNSLLEVHTANHKVDMVDGLVLPLFEKHNVPMNRFTYEHLFRMLIDKRNYEGIIDLWEKMKRNNMTPTQKTVNVYLESSLRANFSDGIVEALQTVKEIKKTPDPWLIRRLTNMYDLPDRIYVELQDFLPYNLMNKPRWKMFTPASFREKSRSAPKSVFRRNNKRVKLR